MAEAKKKTQVKKGIKQQETRKEIKKAAAKKPGEKLESKSKRKVGKKPEVKVWAKHIGARISPKKMALVMNLVRGKTLYDAKVVLTFDQTKSAKILLKVLKSAEANAINSNKLKSEDLYISQIWAGPGPSLKRGRPSARLHYGRIFKRSTHIYVCLSEKGQKGK